MANAQQTEIVDEVAANRLRGFIVRVIRDDYSFIRTDDGGNFFAHLNQFREAEKMRQGQLVEFTPVANTAPDKSDRATNIEAI